MLFENFVSFVLRTAIYLVPDRTACFLHRRFGGKNHLRIGLEIPCKEDQRLGSVKQCSR